MSLEGAIAVHRFGLGARPGEIARASGNPKAWLIDQLSGGAPMPEAPPGGAPNAGKLVSEEEDYKAEKVRTKGEKAARKEAKGKIKGEKTADASSSMTSAPMTSAPMTNAAAAVPMPEDKDGGNMRKQVYNQEMAARLALGITTDKPFAERLVRFWSNHFTVSGQKKKTMLFVGDYEREAIRPHITGTFEDMLFAVCMHPAMQIYLDNWHSTGPGSPTAQRNTKKGLNENLGRELMELYTLGVDAGYTQADVVAMAKLLSGWGIYDGHPNGFGFYQERHEPGEITLRGKTYPPGWDGAAAAIKDLAHDPATARHIARKFATHFISDDPPAESVKRLETVFNDTGGNLHALSEAVVKDPAAWNPELRKFRTPIEFVTAAMRLTAWNGQGEHRDKQMKRMMASTRLMGETPFEAPSPKGWPDTADAWSGSDGLLGRIQWAKEFGDTLPQTFSVGDMANDGLGPLLRPNTKTVMAKANSKSEAVALLLSSPEFQRR
jgi:uncharacterized protein (DUF1800 family)